MRQKKKKNEQVPGPVDYISPGKREPAVVPCKRLRKILQEEEPERRVEVILHLRVRLSLVRSVLQVRPTLRVQPESTKLQNIGQVDHTFLGGSNEKARSGE